MFIKVKVQAGVKKEKIQKKGSDSYIISIREKAERNMANRRIIQMISLLFNVSTKQVRIINGHQSPSKIISVNLPTNLV